MTRTNIETTAKFREGIFKPKALRSVTNLSYCRHFYGLTRLRRNHQKQSLHAQHYGSALISLFGLMYLYASFR